LVAVFWVRRHHSRIPEFQIPPSDAPQLWRDLEDGAATERITPPKLAAVDGRTVQIPARVKDEVWIRLAPILAIERMECAYGPFTICAWAQSKDYAEVMPAPLAVAPYRFPAASKISDPLGNFGFE
jgi:hypothetical protein